MIHPTLRRARIYGAFALLEVKNWIAMGNAIWYWAWTLKHLITMVILLHFWQSVYAHRESIAGLNVQQTITYAMIAALVTPQFAWSYVPIFGARLRNGNLAVEMLRPLDYQGSFFVAELAKMIFFLVRDNVVALSVAVLFLNLKLPLDLALWGCFLVTLLLGYSVMHCFDWAFGTIAFYVNAYWGIRLMREGMVLFFSGALVPLVMMPSRLQQIATWLPFHQAVYTPVALLTGIIPIAEAPRIWLVQVMWLLGLWALSRVAYAAALRHVAINGG